MKYPVFLQALALTIVVFLIGMYSGIALEDSRMNQITDYQLDSEVALIDVINLDNVLSSMDVSCEELKQANFDLLDRVYEEAQVLDQYEEVQRLTKKFNSLHKKYDVLRSYLWVNAIEIKEKCGDDFNTIVYLYNNSEEDLTIKAEQNVWSKILSEVKQEKGQDVLLIPIDANTDLISLHAILSDFNVTRYPTVVVNEKTIFSELASKEEVLAVLK
ncbi:hypothetical protein GW932_01735 [archaeon]|nr:hypothetical protein [archaeon]